MTGKASRCQSSDVSEHSEPVRRQLVVLRYARAEPGGETDLARELAQRGWDDAVEAGRWLAGKGLAPQAALVSAARRTTSTWLALVEGGSFEAEATYSESLYNAGPETALDLVRETDAGVTSLVVVGHNPTMAYLAQLLDDGTGDEGAARDMAVGFPTGALAWFEVQGGWGELELASARLVGFHAPSVGGVRCSQRRGGGDQPVLEVERLDLLAGDPEEVHDRVEVGHVDGRVRRLLHEGLGVVGDPQAGDLEHVEVVGAVADGHHRLQRQSALARELAQPLGLARPVDHGADDAAGEAAVDDLELVGPPVVDAEVLGEPVGDLGEAAGDQREAVAEAAQDAHQRPGARGQDQLVVHLGEGGLGDPLEQRDPLAEGLLEVELAAHRPLRDLSDAFGVARVGGEQLDHLALDQRGVD